MYQPWFKEFRHSSYNIKKNSNNKFVTLGDERGSQVELRNVVHNRVIKTEIPFKRKN